MKLKSAIKRICDDLNIWSGDRFTQDWAYELPDEFRTEVYFSKYLSAYARSDYGPSERSILMALLLDLTNDYLDADQNRGARCWSSVEKLIKQDPQSHFDLIRHWACAGQSLVMLPQKQH